MSKNLFCHSSLIILYILRNKIKIIIFVNSDTIKLGFGNEKFVEIFCKKHEIITQMPDGNKTNISISW